MASPWWWCTRSRSFLSPLLICIAVALITYNAILFSTNARLHSDLSTSSLHFHRTLAFAHSHNPRAFHTAVTASDSVYNTWQCRVMYYWFKKARESRVGSDMGGFTRILHSGKPDSFMEEIPTFVAEPLPDGTDQVRFWKFVWILSEHPGEIDCMIPIAYDWRMKINLSSLNRLSFLALSEWYWLD